jgi:hypothetical protein
MPLWLIRPTAGDGDIASLSGTITWDPSVLSYTTSGNAANGWFWAPNAANVTSGTLGFGAIAAGGTAATFALAELTFDCVGSSGSVSSVTVSVTVAADESDTDILPLVQPTVTRVTIP